MRRDEALACITSTAGAAYDQLTLPGQVQKDLQYAEGIIAQAVSGDSWARNASWVKKFMKYICDNCTSLIHKHGTQRVLTSDTIATAFLAYVVQENPQATTRVASAKRAINLLRAFAKKGPLEDNAAVRYLARGAKNAVVRTTRQSPAMLMVYIASIVRKWGFSNVWWKRQVALMILLSFCALARGAGVTSCLRRGIAWILMDGTQPPESQSHTFQPSQCSQKQCTHPTCVRGFLLLFPARKNRRNSPSWIPIGERSAIKLMGDHLHFLRSLPPGNYMFPARKRHRPRPAPGATFVPNTGMNSKMSTSSFRSMVRLALVDCCGLTWEQAMMFGTHSPRIGTTEELRRCGVSSEMRQQLGAWMTQSVALSYLQLNPSAQFDLLKVI